MDLDDIESQLSEAVMQEDISSIKRIAANDAYRRTGLIHGWLLLAASEGKGRSLEALLSNQADPNFQNSDGETALTFAAANDHLQIAKLLFDAGALVNHQDRSGATAADWAKHHASSSFQDWLKSIGGRCNLECD